MSQYTEFEVKKLFESQFFSSLDYFFADSMSKAFDETDSIVLASSALVSKALSEGDICLDIKKISNSVVSVSKNSDINIQFPAFDIWIRALKHSSMVSETIKTPLVLDSKYRLYLSKYFDFQDRLICNIVQRVGLQPLNIDKQAIDAMVNAYFPGTGKHIFEQKKTVKHAVCNHFTIISGGPGTGKTFIISIIKNILSAYAAKHDLTQPKITCVAPTGKAASKMENGSTIHSILKPLNNTPGFYYNKHNPLPTDVIIIDETSMVDILLLTRLLEAVPITAKVILLGDKNQLSSVQAGSVFSDICSVNNLSPHIFFLEYNFRSKGKTGIENLSKAINKNDMQTMEFVLTSGKYPDVVFVPLHVSDNEPDSDSPRGKPCFPEKIVNKHIVEGYKSLCNADTIEAALDELDNFKILCAHNAGEYGTLQINNVCEKILRLSHNSDIDKKSFKNRHAAALVDCHTTNHERVKAAHLFFHIKIIMINTNDYQKGLFNGDTGVCFEKRDDKEVFFKSFDNNIRQYRLVDLPDNDTAFAITIHKSQGSEFNSVLIILPDKLSPVVTRQLLYTGVTRAKTRVIIVGDLNIIKKAIGMSVERNSGLTDYLAKAIQDCEITG